ncbi:nucleolar and coiled-body phosphoprotein 1-like [Spea bombifrons]|uniref:nucleolar and coiled-body phosphoprotein 1-like n=1 Tax=Spea bombifrons TaxID=233779 RepID=UPI00234B2310|nr:nucleolar and coiled-body phosphoprotein 1-like [Spea bombifrons]
MSKQVVVPCDLFPPVLHFLLDNQFTDAAKEFTRATGVKDNDPCPASLLDIYSYWVKSANANEIHPSASGAPAKRPVKDYCSSEDSSCEVKEPPAKSPGKQLLS